MLQTTQHMEACSGAVVCSDRIAGSEGPAVNPHSQGDFLRQQRGAGSVVLESDRSETAMEDVDPIRELRETVARPGVCHAVLRDCRVHDPI